MHREKWKQKLSGLLAGVMLLGACPTTALAWDAPNGAIWEAATDPVAARFFVGSDTHIDRSDAAKKLTNALSVFSTVDPDADGVLLVGDITNNGTVSEYDSLMRIINGSAMKDKVVLSMGNHEYNYGTMDRFEEKTGQEASQVLYYTAEGLVEEGKTVGKDLVATVIKLSAKNYGGDYTDNYDMMAKALETANTANSKAPILVMGHHGIKDTAYVTNEWNGNYGQGEKDMVALMKDYPQVIHFSGHSHATLEDARSIYQDDGYTAIQDGTIGAYFENETGKVDPETGSTKGATCPPNSEVASQALQVDIEADGTVTIYRMNLTTGEYMYEPWVFNASEKEMPYTAEREEESEAPAFDAGASVTVVTVEKNTAVVTFPAAKADSDSNSNLDMIHEYAITLTPTDGGEVIERKVFSDYYMPAGQQKDTWSVKLIGLDYETTYSVEVTALTSFEKASEPITGTTFTTPAQPVYVTPKADVLNINFADGQGTDANGHAVQTMGDPTFSVDETLGMTVAHFDGDGDGLRYTMTEADYNKYKDGYTMECLMKLNGSGNPFSNQESAGCGFELNNDEKTLEFWNSVNGEYKIPEYASTSLKGAWVHAVATFDGENTKLYINGELKDTVDGAGSMKVPADGAKYFYIGADTNPNGNVQNACDCDVALARLYSGAMNAIDVAKAYRDSLPSETVAPDDLPAADILNVDFSTGSEADGSGNELTATKRGTGSVAFETDETLGRTVANFDGSSAYSYPMADQYSKLSQSMTFAVTYQYNSLTTDSEYDLLSNQQGGGFGLGTDGGKLKFFCYVDGGYKTPSIALTDTGVWHHAVGVFDGSSVKLYVDGACVSTVAASGTVGLPDGTANEIFVGGDSNTGNGLQFPSNVKIASAQVYSQALTAAQIKTLADQALTPTQPEEPIPQTLGMENASASLALAQVGRYSSGMTNKDGGVMEIVAYDQANGYGYAINGQKGTLAAIPLEGLEKGQTSVTVLKGTNIDVKALVEANEENFVYGDMTSVALSPDGKTLAAAIQAKDYTAPGRVALFTCGQDGSLTFVSAVETGVQPDMVTFTPDGAKILTANEGEPRLGYTADAAEDPAGSVTVIDAGNKTARTIGFTAYDSDDARQALVEAGVVLKKETAPSVDLEPEYIACSDTTAYVTLQEANAVAVLDLSALAYRGIYSAGFENYAQVAVDINAEDEKYAPATYENLLGIRMPDGISLVTIGGVDYLLTANEGDSRSWPVEDTTVGGVFVEAESETNEIKGKKSPTGQIELGKKVTWFDVSQYEGLTSGTDYLFGGRSFTLFRVTETGLEEVFDSGSDLEAKTATYLPDYFNCSNDDLEIDSRSGKKGPEPESVTTGQVGDKTYAFVTLERIGGVMVYDVTGPSKVSYVNYINSRAFDQVDEDGVGADDSPEGLAFVPASQSPTGSPLLLAACEVGGTVAAYELTPGKTDADHNSGSSSGSGSSNTTTETTKNPDGSTTTTVTNHKTGTVTETTKYPDGATQVVETKKDGAVTTTDTAANGVKVETVAKPGQDVTASVTLPSGVDQATVTIPAQVDYGFVAVKADTGEAVTLSVPTKDGMAVTVEGSAELILVDQTKEFSDTQGHWAADAIDFTSSHQLFAGVSQDAFAPEDPMTRAMLMTVLARFDGQDTASAGLWYETAMDWAMETGISDGSDPNGQITREQLATMLWRYSGSPDGEGGLEAYPDQDTVSGYAVQAMQWAVSQGIISGMGDGSLAPQEKATRAQVATILLRYVQGLVK